MLYCLIIDDEEDSRTIAQKHIAKLLDCKIKLAANAREAKEMCSFLMPDLVLLDWRMPGMNGLEFLKRLRRMPDGNHPVVIMCTCEGTRDSVESAMENGANGYIVKPYTGEQIDNQLKNLGWYDDPKKKALSSTS